MLNLLIAALLPPSIDIDLPAGPGSISNPLKGYAPYENNDGLPGAPFNMAFYETSWRELEPKQGRYEFDKWEAKTFQSNFAKTKQIALRVWMDYPNQKTGIPQWLLDQGLKTTAYSDFGGGQSPDYSDPNLRAGLKKLIAAMGARWNNNPHVAYIQIGLLGHWGEWHTYPRDELFASQAVQREVIDGMKSAFPNKQLMARNADNYQGRQTWLGFHDDMIPQDTLGPEEWQFLPSLRRAKRDQNWKTAPIGGEMVPGAAEQYLGEDWEQTKRAVKEAHLTWIGPYCPTMVNSKDHVFIKRTAELSQMLGYQFSLRHLKVTGNKVTVDGVNEGVAPFYYPWPLKLALIDSAGKVTATTDVNTDIRKWLPGQFQIKATLPTAKSSRPLRLAIGIIDPWQAKPTVQFANRLDVVGGWTILTPLAP